MAKKRSDKRAEFRFKPGQALTENSPYSIIDRSGRLKASKDGLARPINQGGAGVVYRALYKNMERAIKILNPYVTEEKRELWDQFEHTFEQEILLLSKLTHTYISKLMDYGEALINGKKYKYYVMDYIPGKHFDKIWSSSKMTDFLLVWNGVLSALIYLHGNGVMHMDVKEDNILIRKVGNVLTATLVDLGVSKVIGGERRLLGEKQISGQTYVFSSERITRPERRPYLSHSIDRSELKRWFPDHDLYACGKVLDQAFKNTELCTAISEEGGSSCLSALGAIRDRLLGPPEDQYISAHELQNDLEKLSPGYLSPLGVPEMALAANVRTNIALPHARVALTERTYELVDNPLFQRLRNIPQLDFAYLLYPGAKHTRFLHSLYTFHLAREYVSHLLGDPSFRLLVDPEDIEALLIWALLHDVGQYPLSHMFEDFAEEEKRTKTQRTIFTDEDLFWSFILHKSEEGFVKKYAVIIEKELGIHSTSDKKSLRKVIAEKFSSKTIESLKASLAGSGGKYRILYGLMSSPIDIDKVSYLILDSELTGVAYGLGIDLDALLTSLRVPSPDDLVHSAEPLIAIKDKGLSAAESVVLARYWMLRRVYWHHANRSVMAMGKFVIGSLLRTGGLKFEDYFRATLFSTHIDAMEYLSKLFERGKKKIEQIYGRKVRNPLDGILGGERRIYRRLITVSHGPSQHDKSLHQNLSFKRWKELDTIVQTIIEKLEKSHLAGPEPICRSDVLLDIPVKKREELGAKVLVYLQKEPDRGRELCSGEAPVSPILSSFAEEFDRHVKKCRVLVSWTLYDRILPNLAKVRELVLRTLEDTTRTPV